jgi:two-component system, OmpR family, phosphate regulon sensor histidine kinase PhoR
MPQSLTYNQLYQELLDSRKKLQDANDQLDEARQLITAIREGEVDALIVNGADGHQLYTLKTADETYRIFIEQMNEGAVTVDENSVIMYSNSRFAELVGISLSKIFGQSFFSFVAHAQSSEIKKIITEAWHSNVKTECMLQRITGETVPVSLSLKVLSLDEVPALSIIITDLTLQKQIQNTLKEKNEELEQAKDALYLLNRDLEHTVQERTQDLEETIRDKEKVEISLRQNERRLSDILETMAEGVCIVNREGRLEYANAMAHQLLSIPEQSGNLNFYRNDCWENTNVSGLPLDTDTHPMYISMTTGKTIYDFELGIRKPGKELMYISINTTPVYDNNGVLAGSIGTFTDVTNRRIILQQKDDFINVASHELKTPVTTLNGYLQMLDDSKAEIPEQTQYLVEKARQSMARVIKLIHELLDNSKITSGQLSIQKSEFILYDVVRDCVQHIDALDADKVTIKGDVTQKVYADPGRIAQVVSNLLSNAFKYAAGCPKVTVSIETKTQSVQVTVTDTGPGIEQVKIPHLFDKYYQASENASLYSGLGLGLYICAEIIKKHEGGIGVKSTIGTGSSFWFTLPLY